MKKKTRHVHIEEKQYVYVLKHNYSQQGSHITLSISLSGLKNMICSFNFCTWEDQTGSPLWVGTSLKNMTTDSFENFNLHHPGTVRQFILYGLANGWTRANRFEFHDGLEIIGRMGYDVSGLKP